MKWLKALNQIVLLVAVALPLEVRARDLCFIYPSMNADKIVVSGIKSLKASKKGQTYPVYGRLAVNGTCNGSSAVGLFGTAIVPPDGQRLRLFLTEAGMPSACVPGWLRFDVDTATLTGTWNAENPRTGQFSGSDLTPIDCAGVALPD
jgi:hypothetical protein